MSRTAEEIQRDVKAAFDELDPLQMDIFRQMTPERKVQVFIGLQNAIKETMRAFERMQAPELSSDEIEARVVKRLLKYQQEEQD